MMENLQIEWNCKAIFWLLQASKIKFSSRYKLNNSYINLALQLVHYTYLPNVGKGTARIFTTRMKNGKRNGWRMLRWSSLITYKHMQDPLFSDLGLLLSTMIAYNIILISKYLFFSIFPESEGIIWSWNWIKIDKDRPKNLLPCLPIFECHPNFLPTIMSTSKHLLDQVNLITSYKFRHRRYIWICQIMVRRNIWLDERTYREHSWTRMRGKVLFERSGCTKLITWCDYPKPYRWFITNPTMNFVIFVLNWVLVLVIYLQQT